MNKGLILGVASFVFIGFIVVAVFISYNNQEIELKNLVVAQVETRDANFDKTWKIIQQQAQLTDRYADDFKEVYQAMLGGRYGEDGSQAMWQWIQEQNPQLDASLYTTVQTTIEAQRNEFFTEQKKLISYHREHKNLREKFPGSIIVGNRPDVDFEIITSEVTRQAAATGEENNISVF